MAQDSGSRQTHTADQKCCMFLSQFGVKNYKCLGDVEIPLTPIHVLIGPNDSGKTSLLEALDAFCASADLQLAQLFPQPWTGRELVRQGTETDRIELHGQWTDRSGTQQVGYGLSVVFPDEGQTCSASDEWMSVNGERTAFTSRSAITFLHERRHNPSSQSPVPRGLELAAKDALRRAHRYAWNARLMAIPAAINPDRRFRLDPDGFGLATLLDDILGHDPDLFLRLRQDFCRFFPEFRSVRVETEIAMNRRFQPSGLHDSSQMNGKGIHFETAKGQHIRARQASDGAILFLGFLALAYLPQPPSVLLIEEPENGIYPKRLGEVITLLRETVSRVTGVNLPQIMITTHSPYLVSYFQPEEVTFLGRRHDDPDMPVRARPLRAAPHIHERLACNEFYLGELWYNLTEEELFGDG
jgi:predicted ATPase